MQSSKRAKVATIPALHNGEKTQQDSPNDYELRRKENIQRNLEFLRSMGVSIAKTAARTAAANIHNVLNNRSLAPRQKKKISEKKSSPTRYSMRLRGESPMSSALKDAMQSADSSNHSKEKIERLEPNFAAEALNLNGNANSRLLKKLSGWDGTTTTRDEYEHSINAASHKIVNYQLDPESIVKVTDDRIYSLVFHPREDKLLVASGSTSGQLALWTPNMTDDKDVDPVATYRPHTLPVSRLLFDPESSTSLLSSSFDGSFRRFDLRAAMFHQIVALPDDEGISDFIYDSSRKRYILSSHEGKIWLLDERERPENASSFASHDKKVNTVHQHPVSTDCIMTASLDRTVHIWDLRKLSRSKRISTKHLEPIISFPHERSVNCAYFSPSGAHCVTVCQNNFNYVYETSSTKLKKVDDTSPEPLLAIPHNNQTGRWITKLHPSWNPKYTTPKEEQYIIGCMLQPRRLQIFSPLQKAPVQELTSEHFRSIHSINVFHPSFNVIASGNSSGRLCLWST
uniref:Uncharacterized protein AlNc14C210G8909 n=1 Tax=Albugo laibachii Nc14 TaxID=890382 RepID=F0WRA2_9STRA|nr:PREDICTED: hypothetical protein [Albugo laibachii Nc14]CCA24049.1 PREDICTED: hypothetical protein [Albugo laibachii Nc14]|eukprot:CCA24049.1 PREDICTED: hypothetical protein [Albugo laibachii Nc14]